MANKLIDAVGMIREAAGAYTSQIHHLQEDLALQKRKANQWAETAAARQTEVVLEKYKVRQLERVLSVKNAEIELLRLRLGTLECRCIPVAQEAVAEAGAGGGEAEHSEDVRDRSEQQLRRLRAENRFWRTEAAENARIRCVSSGYAYSSDSDSIPTTETTESDTDFETDSDTAQSSGSFCGPFLFPTASSDNRPPLQ